jgi:hypothetical protein
MKDSDREPFEYQWCAGKSVNEMMAPGHPRSVLETNRPWMEAYCSLDEGELQHRLVAVRAHDDGFALWMGLLAQCRFAFSHPYTFNTRPQESYVSAVYRLELLGLAGGNIKLALDAALAGYYSGCMAIERHMLETWRRSAYMRLHPTDIWRWIPRGTWPAGVRPASDTLSVEHGGMPTRMPKADQIAAVINDSGVDDDQVYLKIVQTGMEYLNEHAHPSFEGASQTRDPNDLQRRYFGPAYVESLALDSLKWGLIAGVILLAEIGHLTDQGSAWNAQLSVLESEVHRWGSEHL